MELCCVNLITFYFLDTRSTISLTSGIPDPEDMVLRGYKRLLQCLSLWLNCTSACSEANDC
jgi:hypothetical protein